MGEYTHILVAVDLTEESRHVSKRACALRTAYGAELSCAHVIEPLSLAYGGDIPMDLSTIQEQIQEAAKAHLEEFAQTLSIASAAMISDTYAAPRSHLAEGPSTYSRFDFGDCSSEKRREPSRGAR